MEIDNELQFMQLPKDFDTKIQCSHKAKKHRWKYTPVAAMLCLVLCGATVYAGYYIHNKITVNEETLPVIDNMYAVEANQIPGKSDEYGTLTKELETYSEAIEALNIPLLNSNLAENSPYTQVNITTDNKDYSIIKVNNYILGDTSNYELVPDVNLYNCTPGEVYYSSISLEANVILSEEQMNNGWDYDYLGFYEYVESFESAQGYKVNIVQDTLDEGDQTNDIVSQKCAVFVADGIRYIISGRVDVSTLKQIIDSFHY